VRVVFSGQRVDVIDVMTFDEDAKIAFLRTYFGPPNVVTLGNLKGVQVDERCRLIVGVLAEHLVVVAVGESVPFQSMPIA
jgi:hypothetical protein